MGKSFNPQIGRATQFGQGNRRGGRPRTANLRKAFEAVAKEAGPDKMNQAQLVAAYCLHRALRGSPRHAEIFLRFIDKKLQNFFESSGSYYFSQYIGRAAERILNEFENGGRKKPAQVTKQVEAIPDRPAHEETRPMSEELPQAATVHETARRILGIKEDQAGSRQAPGKRAVKVVLW
jgi:hypothetical protein